MNRILSQFGQHRILGGAAVLACLQLGASIMGLIRDRTLAATELMKEILEQMMLFVEMLLKIAWDSSNIQ